MSDHPYFKQFQKSLTLLRELVEWYRLHREAEQAESKLKLIWDKRRAEHRLEGLEKLIIQNHSERTPSELYAIYGIRKPEPKGK